MEDRLRLLMEECEQPQGFHLLVDWDSGFGGVAACLSQLLQDEYASKSVFAVASSAPHNTFTSSLEKVLVLFLSLCLFVCFAILTCVGKKITISLCLFLAIRGDNYVCKK